MAIYTGVEIKFTIINLGARWGVSGQLHAPTALAPGGNSFRDAMYRRPRAPESDWTLWRSEKSLVPVENRIPFLGHSVRNIVYTPTELSLGKDDVNM
jgi:hypothetical protein